MKKWTSDSGSVFYRYRDGIVLSYGGYVIMLHRLNGDAVEVSANTVDWIPVRSSEHAKQSREAIAALWPAPTKDQLWRKVKRLAGDLIFFRPNEPLIFQSDAPVEEIRKLVEECADFDTDEECRIAARLNLAFEEWKAAK